VSLGGGLIGHRFGDAERLAVQLDHLGAAEFEDALFDEGRSLHHYGVTIGELGIVGRVDLHGLRTTQIGQRKPAKKFTAGFIREAVGVDDLTREEHSGHGWEIDFQDTPRQKKEETERDAKPPASGQACAGAEGAAWWALSNSEDPFEFRINAPAKRGTQEERPPGSTLETQETAKGDNKRDDH